MQNSLSEYRKNKPPITTKPRHQPLTVAFAEIPKCGFKFIAIRIEYKTTVVFSAVVRSGARLSCIFATVLQCSLVETMDSGFIAGNKSYMNTITHFCSLAVIRQLNPEFWKLFAVGNSDQRVIVNSNFVFSTKIILGLSSDIQILLVR